MRSSDQIFGLKSPNVIKISLQSFTGPGLGLGLEDIEFALQYFGIGFVDRERFCIQLDLA